MKTNCEREKKYDRSFDRFDDPSLMALVFFFDRYLMVYKPVNVTGARSLKIFPSFAINFLEMKPERETMVNCFY